MAHLTCPQRWVQYLRLLQESIWPDGALPKCPRPVRTPEQKAAAEKQALQSLMGVLPGDSREADGAIAFLPTPLSCHYPTPFRTVFKGPYLRQDSENALTCHF